MSFPVAPLALSDEDRAELSRLLQSGPPRMPERARIVLACADGKDNKAVAAQLRVGEHMAARWRGRFTRQRLDGLGDEKRPGRPDMPTIRIGDGQKINVHAREWPDRRTTTRPQEAGGHLCQPRRGPRSWR